MPISLSPFLLNDKVNRTLAGLDNRESMSSVFVRDMVDVGGRVYVARRRSPYEVVEVGFEQTITSIIWSFGIRWCKRLYETAARGLHNKGQTAIQLPQLEDMGLIGIRSVMKNLKKPMAASIQEITTEKINRYAAPELKQHLLDLIGNKNNLKLKYRNSAVLKFLVATLLPSTFLGFGLPMIKQAFTRAALANDHANGHSSPKIIDQHQDQLKRLTQSHGYSGLKKPSRFSTFTAGHPQWAAGSSNTLQGKQALASPHLTTPQFGFLTGGVAASAMNGVTRLLQNEQWNSMIVDATISGGRIYQARNIYERIEELFQETSLIFFAYFALSPLQNFYSKHMDKWRGTNSNLRFEGFKMMLERYQKPGGGLDAKAFLKEFPDIKAALNAFENIYDKYDLKSPLFETTLNISGPNEETYAKSNKLKKLKQKELIGKAFDEFEAHWAKEGREYVLEKHSQGRPIKNLILDLADTCGLLPKMKSKADGKIYNDLTRTVKTHEIHDGAAYLKHLFTEAKVDGKHIFEGIASDVAHQTEAQAEHALKQMNQYLKRSMSSRFGSFFLGMATCSVFLAYFAPRFKQQLTIWLTGKDQFPGVMNGGQRQGLFETEVD